MLVELHCTAGSKVLYANPPDWSEMWAWRRILRPGDLFVDVGSNDGAYALWAAEVGARVIAVEPDPDAATRLRRNITLNRFPIEHLQCALAAEPGRMTLTSGNDTTNHLLVREEGTGTVVDVRTLDDVLGPDRAVGVKVDVEGAERLVLAGACRALAEQRIGVLQLEWNQLSERTLGETRAPLLEMLRGYGYQVRRPDQQGRLHPTEAREYGPDLFAVAGTWPNA
ncbi:FkbM family methyltransferase [Micromonospora sp. CPCC 206061]|uniref:FkbM family methyltransferase n=1 Tax=Micromonospora sp. CPCC 206061 TaxID=3122410 RepID=UPI002FEFC5EC